MPIHAEKRVLPYTPAQLFDLVADVERYPAFLPWCVAVRVRRRETTESADGDDKLLVADMVIGFKVFRERFTTRVQCRRPDRIDVTYTDGPFRYLNNHWVFSPKGDNACEIEFFVDFEFRSAILQKAIGLVFNEAVQKMINSFEARAEVLYGPLVKSPVLR
tara:strand:- start:87 stop:569 length:483 start_codon:yes stop_codon:yes gene_type:complete